MANTRRLSDASLVRRSQQGDRRAFGALVGRYDWRLRGLAHALLIDPVAMDEALSLAYLRAWRDIVRLTAKEDVGAWLYRATYNACIDRLRRDGPSPRAPAEAGGGRRRGTRTGLAALAPSDRVALVLVDREEFSPEAAARILGLTPATLVERVAVARAVVAGHLPPPRPAPPAKAPEAEAAPEEPEPAAAGSEPEDSVLPANLIENQSDSRAERAEQPETTDDEQPVDVPVSAAAPPAEAEPEAVAIGGNGNGADGDGHEPDAEHEAEAPADTEVSASVGSTPAPATGGSGRPAPRRGRRARQRSNRPPPDGTA